MHRRFVCLLLACGFFSFLHVNAQAAITGAHVVSYPVSTTDFGGTSISVNVQDLYLTSDDAADVALNVFNFDSSTASNMPTSFFQSATSTGWLAQNAGGIFDNPALRLADSFVTIGGFAQNTLQPEQAPGAGAGTGLDPNFGGNTTAAPGALAGWYNGNPPNLNGQVGQVADGAGGFTLGVLVGRFAVLDPVVFDLTGATLEVTWNQGLGTGGQQAAFTVSGSADGGATAVPEASTVISWLLMGVTGLGLAGCRRRQQR